MERDVETQLHLQDQYSEQLLEHGQLESVLSLAGVGIALLTLSTLTFSYQTAAGQSVTSTGLPLSMLLPWLAFSLGSAGWRLSLFRRFEDGALAPLTAQQLLSRAHLALLGSSLMAGTAVVFALFSENQAGALPLGVLLAALAALGTSLYAGSSRAFLCGFLPGALVCGVGALVSGVVGGVALVAALLMLGVAGTLLSKRLATRTQAAVAWRHDLEAARVTTDEQERRLEKMQGDFKALQRRRERLELDLRTAQADVQLLEGKSKALADTLTRVSPVDQITGLDNRAFFERQVDSEWRRAERDGKKISLVLVEFDDFDAYLEAYGRQTTDTLLKRTGQALRSLGKRAGDTTCRYDEARLGLLLPHCDVKVAERIAEQLRQRVENAAIPHSHSQVGSVATIHVGVASIRPARGAKFNELLKRAEAALYEASFQGGNQVVMYQPLSKLRLEHWDLAADGAVSEQAMTQKLLVWGYQSVRDTLPVGSRTEPQSMPEEQVIGVLTGELEIEVEGHSMSLRSGDCVVIPAGTEFGLAVAGVRPVIRFMATQLR